jgi:predicted 3-demethylubiquinone-9 3-methyltransferase (glyoxalase superfamily)
MGQEELMGQEMAICLWFDDQAEDAASFYTSIFADSAIGRITRFGREGFEIHGKPEGSAMTVDFTLNGMKFIALNGGPQFEFNEAISISITCETQEEIDHYWTRLSEGGEEGPCGWLKDRFGISWQIVPRVLQQYLSDSDPARTARVSQVLYQSKKFEIAQLAAAYEGAREPGPLHVA